MKAPVFYDMTKDTAAQRRRDPNDPCSDIGPDCASEADPVSCWMENPTGGICPFICGKRRK